jgi:hypothetical protein
VLTRAARASETKTRRLFMVVSIENLRPIRFLPLSIRGLGYSTTNQQFDNSPNRQLDKSTNQEIPIPWSP